MNNDTFIKSLQQLSEAVGVSGDEDGIAEILARQMEGFYDSCVADVLGNHTFIKNGVQGGMKIAISAHMDEIGFIISQINPDGSACIIPVGDHDERIIANQVFRFRTITNQIIEGVSGTMAVHLMKNQDAEKLITAKDLRIDFGTHNCDETLNLGINIGDYGVISRDCQELNGSKYVTGKALDDRVGLAIGVEIFRRMSIAQPMHTIIFLATVQEEVGARAAAAAVNNINPDLFIALDVTPALEPNADSNLPCSVVAGKGFAFKCYDWCPETKGGTLAPRKKIALLQDIASGWNIPSQLEVMAGGGTDGYRVSFTNNGIRTVGISIPQKYIHTSVGLVHMDDVQNIIEYITRLLSEQEVLKNFIAEW